MRIRPVCVVGVLVTFVGLPARAEPQGNVALTAGVAGVSSGDRVWSATRMHLGLHADTLFGRSRNADFGLGPYAEGLTAFNDLQVGGGASALVPVHPYLPLVLSGGAYGRHSGEFGWEPGVAAQVFWGSRSFNYRSWYVMAGGLRLEFRQGLGDSRERSVVVAAHLDGEVLMLPMLLAYEWIRGSSD